MASQVRPSKKPLPPDRRKVPDVEDQQPEDYKDKFRVSLSSSKAPCLPECLYPALISLDQLHPKYVKLSFRIEIIMDKLKLNEYPVFRSL